MTEKQRLQCVLNGEIPDKIPHFELDFQIFSEVFGVTLPDLNAPMTALQWENAA